MDKKPNIILCMADDQGWGDVGYYDHPVLQTPVLDDMAASGIRFDQFYAAAPVCSPTRGSVMTGRNPNRFGCFTWGNTLRPQERTLPQALKEAGYVTGHFGKWHLGPVYEGSPVNPGAVGFDEWLSAPNYYDNNPILSREGKAVQLEGESSVVTMDAALEFVEKHSESQQPFFAVVWFGSPHLPHEAAEEDAQLYPDQPIDEMNYYGEITGIDRAMGNLRKRLAELNIRDNTVLWYCSDNGGKGKVSRTGGRGQKAQIYEGGLRVPGIVEWPEKFQTPRVTALPSCTSDIFPTLLDIAGVPIENGPPLDGINLLPLLSNEDDSRPEPLGFWQYPARGIRTPSAVYMSELLEAQKQGKEEIDPERLCLNAGEISQQYSEENYPGHAAWLHWPWKLHRIDKGSGDIVWELYNLEQDREESNNLAAQQEKRVAALAAQLETWQKSVTESLNGKDYTNT